MDTFITDFNSGYKDNQHKLAMSPKEMALIVAMLSAGTAVGALLSAPIGDRWGRRLSLIAAIGIFCLGGILQVCATGIPQLVVGRCVSLCFCPTIFPPGHSSIYHLAIIHTTCARVARLPWSLLPFLPSPQGLYPLTTV